MGDAQRKSRQVSEAGKGWRVGKARHVTSGQASEGCKGWRVGKARHVMCHVRSARDGGWATGVAAGLQRESGMGGWPRAALRP